MNTENPVVLVHGWGFDSRVWAPVILRLKDLGIPYFLLELPGYVTPSDISEENEEVLTSKKNTQCHYEDDMDGLLRSYFLKRLPTDDYEQFIFVGWSMGGQYLTYCAEYYPELCKKLILVASNPCFVANAQWQYGMSIDTYELFQQSLHRSAAQALKHFRALVCQYSDDSNQTLEKTSALQIDKQTLKDFSELNSHTAVDVLQNSLDALKGWDTSTIVSHMTLPIHHILAQQDALVPSKLAETLKGFGQKVRMVDGASHALPWTHPELIIESIQS